MKTGIAKIAGIALGVGILAFSAVGAEKHGKLIEAVIAVESSGNDFAVGDGGKSVGCLQIRKSVVDDVNRAYGTKYTYADRFSRKKSKEIFLRYMNLYATRKRLKRAVTNEDRARIWNGGPDGYAKAETKRYWNRVKRRM